MAHLQDKKTQLDSLILCIGMAFYSDFFLEGISKIRLRRIVSAEAEALKKKKYPLSQMKTNSHA